MKKMFILLCLFSTACVFSNAQVAVNTKQLTGTTWEMVSPQPGDTSRRIMFSDSIVTRTINYRLLGTTGESEFKYYLDDDIPSSFDFSQVGKRNSGQYLIKYNSKTNTFMGYKVLGFSCDTLTLYWKPKPNTVVGGNQGVTFVYRKIK